MTPKHPLKRIPGTGKRAVWWESIGRWVILPGVLPEDNKEHTQDPWANSRLVENDKPKPKPRRVPPRRGH